MKMVLSDGYGGFNISEEFYKHYKIPYTVIIHDFYGIPKICSSVVIDRTDERLIEFIETFGSEAASGKYTRLVVQEIPKGALYRICEYDGREYIELRDEIEWSVAE